MVTHQEVGEGSHNRDEESDERRAIGTPPDLAETVRSLMVELQKKQKTSKSHKFEEFKKAKPPSFDGEIKKGEEAEAWLLGLKKYFRVHDFSENLKAQVATFNLNGKASIWWEDLKNMKGVREEDLSWK